MYLEKKKVIKTLILKIRGFNSKSYTECVSQSKSSKIQKLTHQSKLWGNLLIISIKFVYLNTLPEKLTIVVGVVAML